MMAQQQPIPNNGAGSPNKIVLDRVSKEFHGSSGAVVALDGIQFSIAENEIVTVVGPSGCGKTTLMNIIAGIESPTSGEVRVDGAVVDGPSPARGVIFQQYALFPWLTARKNVEFGLRIKGVPRRERRSIAEHYLDLVGLLNAADKVPKELSGGMKQRCAVARAYAVNPSILLMDEPYGALDALTKVTLQDQLLQTWSKERKTIFFITHDVDEAVYLGHRVLVLAAHPGRIRDVVDVDLPFPRDEETRLSQEFTALRKRVWDGVHHHTSQAT